MALLVLVLLLIVFRKETYLKSTLGVDDQMPSNPSVDLEELAQEKVEEKVRDLMVYEINNELIGVQRAPQSPYGITELASSRQVQAADLTTISSAEETAAIAVTALTKAIVMGAIAAEDTSWVEKELSDWQHAIYRVDLPRDEGSPTGLRTNINKGRESMAYLTYIIDFYGRFPEVMAFVHPHRNGYPKAWHNDAPQYDSVLMLQHLQLETVARRGYVNLRCLWNPGCPDEIQPWREPPDIEKAPEHAFPYFYSLFFNISLEDTRKKMAVVATPCCAQFAVSRKQVQMRPKAEYERFRDLLEMTKYDDYTSGRVMEYMWHLMFGQESIFCPGTRECWCDVFGRC